MDNAFMNNQPIGNNQQMMQMQPPMNQQPQMNPMQLAMMQQFAANAASMQNGGNPTNSNSLVNKLFAGSSIISGPTEGTSIASLKKGGSNRSTALQNHHNNQNTMQVAGKGNYPPQRHPQENPRGYSDQTKSGEQHEAVSNDTDVERDGIRYLVKDINRGLGDYVPSDVQNTDTDETVDNEDEPISKKSDFTLFGLVKEPLVIILLYLIISQNFVRNSLGAYIPYVLPRNDGSLSFIGHLICGMIIASLFMLSKKVLV
jgi:hypothetical protein